MRAVYLVRHGQPEMPDVRRLCTGRLDLPLSQEGERQAEALGQYFRPLFCVGPSGTAKIQSPLSDSRIPSAPAVKVISSPLERCRGTAAKISSGYAVMDDFLEVDMGEWTGRSFEDIQKLWPDIYDARGKDMINTAPPGGESLKQCQARALNGLKKALADYPGSGLVIVAHDGLNRMLASGLSGNGPDGTIPTGSIIRLLLGDDTGGGSAYVSDGSAKAEPSESPGISPAGPSAGNTGSNNRICLFGSAQMPEELPAVIPDESTCLMLLKEAGQTPAVTAHCRAVADQAMRICEALENSGISLNAPLVYSGAMLHDIMKGRRHHAAAGAGWLFEKGYASTAALVGDHMFLPGGTEELINEKTVVFLADKLIKETSRVTLEERYFAAPAPEKMPYVQAHYEQAKHLMETYKKYIDI